MPRPSATRYPVSRRPTGDPLLVTQNGKPAGVLLSPEAFDALTEQARFVAAVSEGIADAGRWTRPLERKRAGPRRLEVLTVFEGHRQLTPTLRPNRTIEGLAANFLACSRRLD